MRWRRCVDDDDDDDDEDHVDEDLGDEVSAMASQRRVHDDASVEGVPPRRPSVDAMSHRRSR